MPNHLEEVKHRYEYLFKITDKNGDGVVEINDAVELFRKSGLSSEQLKIIWDLSGINSTTIQKNELFAAISLIAQVQKGKTPQLNSDEVVTAPVFEGITYPDFGPDWTIQHDQLKTYESYFTMADPDKTNFVSGDVARDLFTKSGLSNQVLAKIWVLSDLDSDGRLNLIEFSIAMHLINMNRKGFDVPTTLPNQLLSSLNMKEVQMKMNDSKSNVEQQDTDTSSKQSKNSLLDTKSSSQFDYTFKNDFYQLGENEIIKEKDNLLLQKRFEEERKIQEERNHQNIQRQEEEKRIQEQRKIEFLRMQQEEEKKLHEQKRQEELRRLEELRLQDLKRQEEERKKIELQNQEKLRQIEEMRKQEALRKAQELMDMKKEIMVMIEEKKNMVNDLRSAQQKKFFLASQLATMEQESETIRNNVGSLELEIEKVKIKGANIREKLSLCTQQIETLQEQKEQISMMTEGRLSILREEEKNIFILEEQLKKNKAALTLQQENIGKMTDELKNLNTKASLKREEEKNGFSKKSTPFPEVVEKKKDHVSSIERNPFRTVTRNSKNLSEQSLLDDFGSSFDSKGSVIFEPLPSTIIEIDHFGKVVAQN